MPNNLLKTWVVTVIYLLFFNGCTTTVQNLLTTEDYTKQTVPHQQTYFRQVWAAESDGEFWVSGRLRLNGNGINVPRYVEVALVDEDGAIIEKQKVTYSPKDFRGRKSARNGAKFIAYFNETPPPGTTIQLSNVN